RALSTDRRIRPADGHRHHRARRHGTRNDGCPAPAGRPASARRKVRGTDPRAAEPSRLTTRPEGRLAELARSCHDGARGMGLPGDRKAADEACARGRVGVGAMVVVYLAVTVWLSWELNVWRDEMYSLHTTEGSVVRAARQAIDFELQPPVYFALLAAWR